VLNASVMTESASSSFATLVAARVDTDVDTVDTVVGSIVCVIIFSSRDTKRGSRLFQVEQRESFYRIAGRDAKVMRAHT
jgi:hypothetical protein